MGPINSINIDVLNEGSIVLFTPRDATSRKWLQKRVSAESWQWQGGSLAVDHRMAPSIRFAINEANRARPKGYKAPKIVRVGRYYARQIDPNHDGALVWRIFHRGKCVGKMFDGPGYGWGRPCFSINELRWSGPLPEGSESPKSPHYGIAFDGGPSDSHRECLERFAKSADRLIAWRKENER